MGQTDRRTPDHHINPKLTNRTHTFTCLVAYREPVSLPTTAFAKARFWAHAASSQDVVDLLQEHACATTPVRRRHPVPRQIPTWRHRHTLSPAMLSRCMDDTNLAVSLYLGWNWISIVRTYSEDKQLRLPNPSRFVQDSADHCHPRRRPSSWQRTVHEAPRGDQSGRRLWLSSPTHPTSSRPRSSDSAGTCTGDLKTRLCPYTAMQHWLVCHWRLSHHYNEFRTRRLAWSSSWTLVNMSRRACCSHSGTCYQ